jgi:hypothetical protein
LRDATYRHAPVRSLEVSDLDSPEQLHADSDLDTEKIYHTLASNPELRKTTMSLAEKLIAQGRTVGHWVGRIQSLEEFLDKPQTSQDTLEAKTLAELEALHQQLHGEYERRFKQS